MSMRVAILGLGSLGLRRARLIEHHPLAELTAVCDANASRLSPFQDTCATYSDSIQLLSELTQANTLDAVIVCVVNRDTVPLVIEAMHRGLHVFSEKPPGRSLKETQQLQQAHQETLTSHPQLKLAFGFNHRHHESVTHAAKLIQSGSLGKPLFFRGVYGKAAPIDFHEQWRSDADIAGGGILLDQGIHMLDLFQHFAVLTGQPSFAYAKAFIETRHFPIAPEDNALAILRNQQGLLASLHSSATLWEHRFELTLGFDHAELRLEGILSGSMAYAPETLSMQPRHQPTTAKQTWTYHHDPSWEIEITHWLEAIQNNSAIEQGNMQDALGVMQLVDAIYHDGRPAVGAKPPRPGERYRHLLRRYTEINPESVIEVGVWKGDRADRFIRHGQRLQRYVGFDLFEAMDSDTHAAEGMGGCHQVKRAEVLSRLIGIEQNQCNIELIAGNTHETLPAFAQEHAGQFDFILIDGGHSVETIANDWAAAAQLLSPTGICIMDDYLLHTEAFGCKSLVDALDRNQWQVTWLPTLDVESNGHAIAMVEIKRHS